MKTLEQWPEELKTLKRIEELLEVVARGQIAGALKELLSKKEHRLLYQLTGTTTRDELVRKTGFSAGKISMIWQDWEALGIVKKDGKQYRRVL